MGNTAITFGARLTYTFEKRNETYFIYEDVSITEVKANIAQKIFRRDQRSRPAVRVGVWL